jgi:hypothetical protein
MMGWRYAIECLRRSLIGEDKPGSTASLFAAVKRGRIGLVAVGPPTIAEG